MLHTSDGKLAALVSSPFAAESLSDAEGFVVLTSPDGTDADAEVTARLASLPCVVIARGPRARRTAARRRSGRTRDVVN